MVPTDAPLRLKLLCSEDRPADNRGAELPIAKIQKRLIGGAIPDEFFNNFPNQSLVITSDYLDSTYAPTDRSVTLDKF